MKIILITAFLLVTMPLFAQKKQFIDLRFKPTASSFGLNYDYRLAKDPSNWLHFYGHTGLGVFSSVETINTKFIKGSTFDANSGALLLDLLAYFLFSTRDKTIERKQYIKGTAFDIGTKLVIGHGFLNAELGLDTRFDVVRKTVDAWDNIPLENSRFTSVYLQPSAAVRLNLGDFVVRYGIEPYRTYQKKGVISAQFFSIGAQF